jgi:hypothetical protein
MTGGHEQRVLSASRRTDIPAFYMDWFMDRLRKKTFESVNPFNGRISVIPATMETVHTVVFWSKNFGPFLSGGYGRRLIEQGFNLFFNFTVNSEAPLLEPKVPPLKERLKQLDALCDRFGPGCVTWRFDPVCWFVNGNDIVKDNLTDFERIAERAIKAGVRRCITSFMDTYPKIQKRIAQKGSPMAGFSFVDPPMEKKIAVLSDMERILERSDMQLLTCCEEEILEAMPQGSRTRKASCIPNDLLMKLYGGCLSTKRDSGQRIRNGCGCMVSVDVGSYRMHPCFHGCMFCYANPA